MQTFRSYGPNDDPGLSEGDTSFIGVNLYDSSENLQPGEVAGAVNTDFTNQDAQTRGGFVCIPELGDGSYGDLFWQARIPADALHWQSVCFGNNTFVAVSDIGSVELPMNSVMTSPNGVDWVTRVSAAANQWQAVCFGNGLFVAVSDSGTGNRVQTSPDGITWTARASASNDSWFSVCFGHPIGTTDPLFVAVSFSGTIMTSPDGIVWTNRVAPAANLWSSVIWGEVSSSVSVFVAVGQSGANRIMYSYDGITWVGIAAPVVRAWSSVTHGNGLFVAVSSGSTGAVMTSAFGSASWTARDASSNQDWTDVTFGNNRFVAVSGGGGAMVSTDAITWEDSSPNNNSEWHAITFGNNLFVAVGQFGGAAGGEGTQVMTSAPMVWASGRYSDPNSTSSPWIVLASSFRAGFLSFGQTSREVAYPAGYEITEQSTIVQANNLLFIFSGPDQNPIQWDGSWGGTFIECPPSTLGAGYENIPFSNFGMYNQNRLWVVNGKDTLSASQALDFKNFNVLAGAFNLNVGTSDFLVCAYPFGDNGIVVFKNHSSFLLQNVGGTLADVTSTEITRQLGIIGINAVTAVGPDLVYMSSDRNITSIRLNLQNATQAVTVPISQKINPIMRRVNWTYGYKVSMGYWNNLLFVALPLDNSTVCNTVLVFNFITGNWYGEWNFDPTLGMAIQGFVTSNYLGRIRMHATTEDGRIFVVDEGQNDISGTLSVDISTSLTTRAYPMDNNNRFTRRLYLDLSTNRPDFSVTAYVDGASMSSRVLTDQTYTRSQSWIFADSPYSLDNSNDDYNRAGRKDYSTGASGIESGSGFLPEMTQDYRLPIITRQNGRLMWLKVTNSTGFFKVNSAGFEARAGYRNNLTQVL